MNHITAIEFRKLLKRYGWSFTIFNTSSNQHGAYYVGKVGKIRSMSQNLTGLSSIMSANYCVNNNGYMVEVMVPDHIKSGV